MRTATDTPRKPARVGLRTKIIGLLSGVILVFSVAFIAYTVWDFVSINQDTINHTSEGDYDFKSLHCAIAGKAVAVLFTRSSDYAIRFTNLNPRNIYNTPDAYETQALEGFYADPGAGAEVYGYAADKDGRSVFRYVRTMVYKQECMECHGTPAGETDVTGYPKEGAHVGDIAGAVSVIMPTELYFSNMRGADASDRAQRLARRPGRPRREPPGRRRRVRRRAAGDPCGSPPACRPLRFPRGGLPVHAVQRHVRPPRKPVWQP